MPTIKELEFTGKITMFSDLIDVNTPVDAIEVHPVCYVDEDEGQVTVCEPEEADFWSVYIHMPDNGLECIADCDSEKTAEQLREMMLKLVNAFRM